MGAVSEEDFAIIGKLTFCDQLPLLVRIILRGRSLCLWEGLCHIQGWWAELHATALEEGFGCPRYGLVVAVGTELGQGQKHQQPGGLG